MVAAEGLDRGESKQKNERDNPDVLYIRDKYVQNGSNIYVLIFVFEFRIHGLLVNCCVKAYVALKLKRLENKLDKIYAAFFQLSI